MKDVKIFVLLVSFSLIIFDCKTTKISKQIKEIEFPTEISANFDEKNTQVVNFSE